VAVGCVTNTSDECAASVFILKGSIERKSSGSVGFLEPSSGKQEATGWSKPTEVMKSKCENSSGPKVGPEAHHLQNIF
jgi:hypothetical protein